MLTKKKICHGFIVFSTLEGAKDDFIIGLSIAPSSLRVIPTLRQIEGLERILGKTNPVESINIHVDAKAGVGSIWTSFMINPINIKAGREAAISRFKENLKDVGICHVMDTPLPKMGDVEKVLDIVV